MGLIHAGPPKQLVRALREQFHIARFIETGTFIGETASWAASQFREVITIEASPQLYEHTARRWAHVGNVRFVQADSRVALGPALAASDEPALLWLDGHWSDGLTFGAGNECPLLQELQAVAASAQEHFIVIDDARLFAAPPPAPHDVAQWPTLDAVMDALRDNGRSPYIVYIEDVIVAVPQEARQVVIDYCRHPSHGVLQAQSQHGSGHGA